MTDALLGPAKKTQPPPGLSWTLHVRRIGAHLYATGNLGRSGVLARTADDGATWQVLLSGVNGLRQVWGASDDEVFVVGEYGFVRRVRASASGIEVTEIPFAGGACIFGVLADDRGRLLVSGDAGVFEWRDGKGFVRVLKQPSLARLYPSPRGVVVIGDKDEHGPALFLRSDREDAGFLRVNLPEPFDAYGFLAVDEVDSNNADRDNALVCGTGGHLWSVSLSNARRPVRVAVEARGMLLAIQRVGDHIVVVGDNYIGASNDNGSSFVTLPSIGDAWTLAVSNTGAVVVAGRGVFSAFDANVAVSRAVDAPLDPDTRFVGKPKKPAAKTRREGRGSPPPSPKKKKAAR